MTDLFLQQRLDMYRRELDNLLKRQVREKQVGGPAPGLLEQRIQDKRALIRRTEERIQGSLDLEGRDRTVQDQHFEGAALGEEG